LRWRRPMARSLHPDGRVAQDQDALSAIDGLADDLAQLDHTVGGGMNRRWRSSFVVFSRSFTLPGSDALHPAGSYEVETEEEPLADLSFAAWRRLSTTIRIQGAGDGPPSTEVIPIDPTWLEQTLAAPSGPDEGAATGGQPYGTGGEEAVAARHSAKVRHAPLPRWEDDGGTTRTV
jgi:hypothetical protein